MSDSKIKAFMSLGMSEEEARREIAMAEWIAKGPLPADRIAALETALRDLLALVAQMQAAHNALAADVARRETRTVWNTGLHIKDGKVVEGEDAVQAARLRTAFAPRL